MHTKIIEVRFDPTGNDRRGCLQIQDEYLSWDDTNLIVRIKTQLHKTHATHVRKVGDEAIDGEVVTVNQFVKELKVICHGFR